MWIKSYIKYKNPELIECNLLFKHGKLQEINMEHFNGITPFQNNSELADNIEILKTYKQDNSNNFCKYFIKKSIDKEVFIMYLELTKIKHFQLQWQLKKYLIQSKDFKMELLKFIVIGSLGFLIAKIYQDKVEKKQTEITKIEETKK